MGQIPANQARGLFTQQLITTYKQIPQVGDFLENFFPARVADTRYLYWSVRREGEPVALDVKRGREANRNTFSLSTDKIVDPPFYHEDFDITQTDLYYRAWNSALINESMMADWMQWVLEHMGSLRNKIKRAYKRQYASILQTGIITLADGTTIDFKRNSNSIVTNSAPEYWTANGVDPFAQMNEGINFLVKYGKATGGNFICIMGENAHAAFLNNSVVLERGQKFYMKLTDLSMPIQQSTGMAYHGRVATGSYTCDMFTLPKYYDASTASPNTSTPYIDADKIIIIPENPDFITGYAAVPFLPKSGGIDLGVPKIMSGEIVVDNYIDPRHSAWIVDMKSAGVALPTAIDMIYTRKVVA